jgi:hypothetical protein
VADDEHVHVLTFGREFDEVEIEVELHGSEDSMNAAEQELVASMPDELPKDLGSLWMTLQRHARPYGIQVVDVRLRTMRSGDN